MWQRLTSRYVPLQYCSGDSSVTKRPSKHKKPGWRRWSVGKRRRTGNRNGTVSTKAPTSERGREDRAGGGVKKMKTVDLETLDCTVCFDPLELPVSQCAAGHVVCSSCYDKLATTQSLQVPCSNARSGCKEEHQKNCEHMSMLSLNADCGSTRPNAVLLPHGLPTDCYTLIMPKVSPSTNISISISGRECERKISKSKREISKSKTSTGPILKMGPCGGVAGDVRGMDMGGVNRILKVVVWHGGAVDSMSVLYQRNDLVECTDRWGGNGGNRSEINLQPGEYLTSVQGHMGHYDRWVVIRSLTFVSNLRSFGPYGKEDGVPFVLPATGGKILGFHARAGGLLDALGTYVKMD